MTTLFQNPARHLVRYVTHLTRPNRDAAVRRGLRASSAELFYQLSAELAFGPDLPFASLKGKQILVVNTPNHDHGSQQYQQLRQLAEQFADRLVVLLFPTAEFGGQPTGVASAGATHPLTELGQSLTLMKRSVVGKHARQHPVYRWLSTSRLNGWNEQAPPACFAKYLVSEHGRLAHYFGPAHSPLSEVLIDSILNPQQTSPRAAPTAPVFTRAA